ncbi:LysR family transcriptional regulator [Rhizobiaceae bacterium BDR2-2]|uniref:LysR family transcriptional regulator n=1 Tax=Ectorhizobium quercum TaxID=2965071 RepID=A0AAE3SW41_9HYPH|nr:LysR family transcriptional regulator [Ectorhizobium quercum]MCX8996164.1 LysR family transcriptional regulator [Ectorhizobium quercum]MCX8998797.1 LysR family transcriptional regulator [Ectorhizobium quercum]
MNWDDVRLFLAVARSGQFLAAARRLGVNHATLARRVSALENALGTQLFVRRPQGCEMTEQGERFLAAAERMETEMLAAQASLGRTDAAISGTVRIGAPDGFGVSFLAPRLGRLAERHPELKLELVPVPRSFSLSRREADIAITIDRPEQGRLVSSKLTEYSLGLYAARRYLDGRAAPGTIDDLRAHRRVGYVEDLLYSASLDFTGEIMRNWNAALEISSATGQFEAVRSGAGIGILHNYIARHAPDLRRLLPDVAIRRAYWITFHESARELARVRAVSTFIQELVSAERKIFQ